MIKYCNPDNAKSEIHNNISEIYFALQLVHVFAFTSACYYWISLITIWISPFIIYNFITCNLKLA